MLEGEAMMWGLVFYAMLESHLGMIDWHVSEDGKINRHGYLTLR